MMSTSDYVLLHGDALRGSALDWNGTTARAYNSQDWPIEVSMSCPERPLVPTILFMSEVPGVDFTQDPPRIVRAVEDLILLRVPVVDSDVYDYFIYRPGGEKGPSLKLIPHTTTFHDEDVGLLRRGEEHYIIAALIASRSGLYALHRFDSKTDKWSKDEVSVVEPQVSFPYGKEIPSEAERLLFHLTSTVIPIGGEGGTMGWVDLWRGILLCDVLSREPKLRGVPLPLPLEHLSCNNGEGTHLGCPKSIRGITSTLIDKEPCLKFVHLGVTAVPVGEQEWKMFDWTITTWSNTKMTTSWKDWHQDCKVKASGTSISSMLNSKMLNYGLLSPGERAFNNILVSFPAPSIIDDGVVYLQARVKFMDLKVFVLALDTRDNKLLGAVEFATKRVRGASVVYLPSNIGKYIDPEDRVMPIPEGGENDSNWEELSKYEGTESLKLPPLVIRFFHRQDFPSSLNDAPVST